MRLMDRSGIKRRYLRSSGLTVDALGEVIFDRRITSRRLDCREVLDLLDEVLAGPVKVNHSKATRALVDEAERKAKSMRLRKFLCPECGQIARASKSSVLVCGICYEMTHVAHVMTRVDPLPEEILAAVA